MLVLMLWTYIWLRVQWSQKKDKYVTMFSFQKEFMSSNDGKKKKKSVAAKFSFKNESQISSHL